MLKVLIRIGSSRHRLAKAYVLSSEPGPVLLQELNSTGTIRVQQDPRNKWGLLLVTDMIWMHTPAARRAVINDLKVTLDRCVKLMRKEKIELLPSAVNDGTKPWRQCLCPDRHSIEVHDELEQAHACNLLAQHAPVLQAFGGRSGVTPTGVETLHWKLGSESVYYSSIEWMSTSQSHRQRMQRILRDTEGIPRLERLEIFPGTESNILTVNSSVADGAAFLSTTLAILLLHDAIVMRARRMAREGSEPDRGWQGRLERNRARVITDGPAAALDPGKTMARDRILMLVEEFLPELRALGVTFEEVQPLVLGPALRRMGCGGVCTENEYLRFFHGRCLRENLEPLAEIRRVSVEHALESPLLEINRRRFPKETEAIEEWWREQLIPAAYRPRREVGNGVKTTGNSGTPPHKRLLGEQRRVSSRPSGERGEPMQPAARLLDLLRRGGSNRPAASLAQAEQWLDPKRLGRFVSELPEADRDEIVNGLAPWSGSIPASRGSGSVWEEASGRRAVEIAKQGKIGVIALEGTVEQEAALTARTAEAFANRPTGVLVFSWRRPRYHARIRQELLVVAGVPNG